MVSYKQIYSATPRKGHRLTMVKGTVTVHCTIPAQMMMMSEFSPTNAEDASTHRAQFRHTDTKSSLGVSFCGFIVKQLAETRGHSSLCCKLQEQFFSSAQSTIFP